MFTELITACPFVAIPNWGAMHSPKEWNRTWEEYAQEELVSVPKYEPKITITFKSLAQHREQNVEAITSRLFYSTHYMGKYDLDAGEHTGAHPGVDLKVPVGTPIRAIADGTVVEVSENDILGIHVVVRHRGGYTSTYAHMRKALVNAGRRVRAGWDIGEVGLTGNTSGAHLHLETRKGGEIVNPMDLLPHPCV